MTNYKKISILGCGWYGLAVAKALVQNGYQVSGSTTRAENLSTIQASGASTHLVAFTAEEEIYDKTFFDCEVLIISIPPKRSTAEQHTFAAKIERISAIATAHKIPQVIFISSTSVYGDQNKELNENDSPLPDTASGEAMLAAENLLKNNTAFTTTILRFAGLFGPERNPGRFFAGKTDIANGRAPVNLIHQQDCVGITLSIIENAAFGQTYNACAPEHPSRQQFYTAAAKHAGLALPNFIDELKSWKTINSLNLQRELNYTFIFSISTL